MGTIIDGRSTYKFDSELAKNNEDEQKLLQTSFRIPFKMYKQTQFV